MTQNANKPGIVVAVSVSDGGVPKIPQEKARITRQGVAGDFHDHDKHIKPARALSLFDEEIMHQLCQEGYDLSPGKIGENITLKGVNVQEMQPGAILKLGQVVIRLETPRKPCYVLDVLDPRLKDEIVGRCGFMASVIEEGELHPGDAVERLQEDFESA